ncbi:MAG TPA: hypothetical protein VGB18_03755 [Candidatus Thermoplasmatota archaeon]
MALTKITVKPHTLKRLKQMKKADMTYDDVIDELLEDREYASPEFRREHFRRLREEKGILFETVVKRLKL